MDICRPFPVFRTCGECNENKARARAILARGPAIVCSADTVTTHHVDFLDGAPASFT